MCRIAIIYPKGEGVYNRNLADVLVDVCLDLSAKQNRDGFGIYLSNMGSKDHQPAFYKKARPCSEIIYGAEFNDWLYQNNSGFGPVIAHVRQATYGKGNILCDDFAHPFTCGNFVLVHNGHLLNADEVKDKLKLDQKYVVDSEIFLQALYRNSDGKPLTLEVIQKTVDLFIGPFVFVVHDRSNNDLFLIIGKERTLHIYDNDRITAIVTEAGYSNILTRAVNRAQMVDGLPYTRFESARKLDQDTVYKIDNNGLSTFGLITSKSEYPKEPKVIHEFKSPKEVLTDIKDVNTISLDSVRKSISARNSVLARYSLSAEEFSEILTALNPLVSEDFYSLTSETIKILEDFLDSLNLRAVDLPAKRMVWSEIKKVSTGNVVEAAKGVSPTFKEPYFLNGVVQLQQIYEELK